MIWWVFWVPGMYVYIYIYTLGVQVDHYIEIGINNSRVDYLAALMVGLTYTVYLYSIYMHFKKGKQKTCCKETTKKATQKMQR